MGSFFSKEHGAAMLEYALLLSLIGMVIVGSLQALGTNVFDGLSGLNHAFLSAPLKNDLLNHP
ncbi:MAG: hypothetical protein NPIRA03_01390 [Nitrospirales bacterium]|nr:MAG: hypothetical protein NPIRA03_01390 [Nitrospirales bacterium]